MNVHFPNRLLLILYSGKEFLIRTSPEIIPGYSKSLVETRLRFPSIDYSDASVSVGDLEHHAGCYKIKHSGAARMFYIFFELRDSRKDLVVIWLIGGLGRSSELAVFYENKPFTIAKNLPLLWIEFGWDKAFFEEHSQFVDNDFYVTGESYAGHYILAFAARVHRGNKANEGIHMKLKGFAIGNGFTNPQIQYKAYTGYALDMRIIEKSNYDRVNMVLSVCEMAIRLCGTFGTHYLFLAWHASSPLVGHS
ncbi:hypothetical protein AAG906_017636 [Vitis piasezkii]